MSFTAHVIARNVCLASVYRPNLGCRIGTRYGVTLYDLANLIGSPHVAAPKEDWYDYTKDLYDGAGKVSAIWQIDTPRGPADLRDYWWNKRDEISIGAADHRTLLWVHRWMDMHNLGTKENKDA